MENNIQIAIEKCFRNKRITSPPTPMKGGRSAASIYKIIVEEKPYIIRYFGSTSSELYNKREIQSSLLADKLNVGPKVFYVSDKFDLLICDFIEGKTLTVDLFQKKYIQNLIIQLFQTLHQADTKEAPASENLFQRIQKHITHVKENHLIIPNFDAINDKITKIKTHIDTYPIKNSFCHNDPYSPNFIITKNDIYLIDWRDSGLNDPFADLAVFCYGMALSKEQIVLFLKKLFNEENLTKNEMNHFNYYYQTNILLQGVWALEKISQQKNANDLLNISPKKSFDLLKAFHQKTFHLESPNDYALYAKSCINDFIEEDYTLY